LYLTQKGIVIAVVAVTVVVEHIFLQLSFEQSQLSLHTGSHFRGVLREPVRVSSSEDAEGISHLDQVLAQIGFRLFCPANLLSFF